MKEFNYTIKDELGIHARPAGLLVKCAKTCESKIYITKGDKSAEATRLLGIMGMAVKKGETVNIKIEGAAEEKDYVTIKEFFESNL
ncbi:MAG: HPr family phosphocarrier protein [Eubacteriales bacterium]|nr:HPr family phosphocarrier protein [Eubacteriales bacterium]